MCGFIIAKDNPGNNVIGMIEKMSYRGLKDYKGYMSYKGYNLAHIALPMVDPDPELSTQPIRFEKDRQVCL